MGARVSFIESDYDLIDYEAGADPDLKGQECVACRRLLVYSFYDKNSAYKSGYDPMCPLCKQAPKMSIAEHTARLYEMNYNSEGTRRQRHVDQDDLRSHRPGRALDCSLFLQKLLHIYPSLHVRQGGVKGDLAVYATSPTAKQEWGGRDFHYMGFVTLGTMPENSTYEFDSHRDILLRVKDVGWRSVLLRFVENNILTEDQCLKEFGPPSGGVNSLWYKKLYRHRNEKKIA